MSGSDEIKPVKWAKMVQNRKKDAEEKKKRVDKAIKDLRKQHRKVNFNTVSKEAEVGLPFLYKHFRDEIDRLRKLNESNAPLRPERERASDASKDVIIDAFKIKQKELEREKRELKEQNARLLGQLLDLKGMVAKTERLEKRIEVLEKKLKEAGIEYE